MILSKEELTSIRKKVSYIVDYDGYNVWLDDCGFCIKVKRTGRWFSSKFDYYAELVFPNDEMVEIDNAEEVYSHAIVWLNDQREQKIKQQEVNLKKEEKAFRDILRNLN